MTSKPRNSELHLNIGSFDTVFDNRDPETLPRRRLDPEWLEYVLETIDDLPRSTALDMTLHTSSAALGKWKETDLAQSLREHFETYDMRLRMRVRENFRTGRTILLLGVLILIVFTGLSVLFEQFDLGVFHRIFTEGFLIIGWVALWRPVDILLYDWWPIVAERRKIARILKGIITITTEKK